MSLLRNVIYSAALGLALSGCANDPQKIVDVHTGIAAGVSARYTVYSNLLVNVDGQAFVATQGSETKYGIYINQIATGMGWSFFDSAYSFGTQLRFQRGQSNVLGCGGGCTTQEQGIVELTSAQFSQAASSGMEILLQGTGNRVVIQVPAVAFQEALAQRP